MSKTVCDDYTEGYMVAFMEGEGSSHKLKIDLSKSIKEIAALPQLRGFIAGLKARELFIKERNMALGEDS